MSWNRVLDAEKAYIRQHSAANSTASIREYAEQRGLDSRGERIDVMKRNLEHDGKDTRFSMSDNARDIRAALEERVSKRIKHGSKKASKLELLAEWRLLCRGLHPNEDSSRQSVLNFGPDAVAIPVPKTKKQVRGTRRNVKDFQARAARVLTMLGVAVPAIMDGTVFRTLAWSKLTSGVPGMVPWNKTYNATTVDVLLEELDPIPDASPKKLRQKRSVLRKRLSRRKKERSPSPSVASESFDAVNLSLDLENSPAFSCGDDMEMHDVSAEAIYKSLQMIHRRPLTLTDVMSTVESLDDVKAQSLVRLVEDREPIYISVFGGIRDCKEGIDREYQTLVNKRHNVSSKVKNRKKRVKILKDLDRRIRNNVIKMDAWKRVRPNVTAACMSEFAVETTDEELSDYQPCSPIWEDRSQFDPPLAQEFDWSSDEDLPANQEAASWFESETIPQVGGMLGRIDEDSPDFLSVDADLEMVSDSDLKVDVGTVPRLPLDRLSVEQLQELLNRERRDIDQDINRVYNAEEISAARALIAQIDTLLQQLDARQRSSNLPLVTWTDEYGAEVRVIFSADTIRDLLHYMQLEQIEESDFYSSDDTNQVLWLVGRFRPLTANVQLINVRNSDASANVYSAETRLRIQERINSRVAQKAQRRRARINRMLRADRKKGGGDGALSLGGINMDGGYFPFVVTNPKFAMPHLGIYDTVLASNYEESCMVKALRDAKVPQMKLDEVKMMITFTRVSYKSLKMIAECLGRCIRVTREVNGRTQYAEFGRRSGRIIEIGLIENHYFHNVIAPWKTTQMEDFDYLFKKHGKDWFKYEKTLKEYRRGVPVYRTKRTRYGNTRVYNIIQYMIDNRKHYLQAVSRDAEILSSIYHGKPKHYTSLVFDEKTNCHGWRIDPKTRKGRNVYVERLRGIEEQKRSPKEQAIISADEENNPKVHWFLDYETCEDATILDGHVILRPALMCYKRFDWDRVETVYEGKDGKTCAEQFFEQIDSHCIVYAHNMGFDFRVGVLLKYLEKAMMIQRGTDVMSYQGVLNNEHGCFKVHLRSTLVFLQMSLARAAKAFNVPLEKELCPYRIYRHDTVDLASVPLADALEVIREQGESEESFLETAAPYIEEDKFKHMEYYRFYCERDVEVLSAVWKVYCDATMERFDISPLTTISFPQLIHRYMIGAGCYKNCFELSGVPRDFIQKTVRGGHVGTFQGLKLRIDVPVADMDCNSLYPAAIALLGGCPQGKPIAFDDMSIDELNGKTCWFAEIEIISVGRRRGQPCISYKDADGLVVRTDDIRLLRGKLIHVNSVDFGLWVKYHLITARVIRGYYFDCGINPTMGGVIQDMYSGRKILEARGEMVKAQMDKLGMNMSYGRTIQKPHNTEVLVMDSTEEMKLNEQINYYRIKESRSVPASAYEVDGVSTMKWIVKMEQDIHRHMSIPHYGSLILATARSHMYEAIYMAEEIGIPVFYMDTDSMHIPANDLERLAARYKEVKGMPFEGDGPDSLGMFSSDFKDKKTGLVGTSVLSHYCGKKIWRGQVQMPDGSVHVEMRMKGIPQKQLENNGGEEVKSPEMLGYDIYEKLINMNPSDEELKTDPSLGVTFDLTLNSVALHCRPDMRVEKKMHFTRRVKTQGLVYGYEDVLRRLGLCNEDTDSSFEIAEPAVVLFSNNDGTGWRPPTFRYEPPADEFKGERQIEREVRDGWNAFVRGLEQLDEERERKKVKYALINGYRLQSNILPKDMAEWEELSHRGRVILCRSFSKAFHKG